MVGRRCLRRFRRRDRELLRARRDSRRQKRSAPPEGSPRTDLETAMALDWVWETEKVWVKATGSAPVLATGSGLALASQSDSVWEMVPAWGSGRALANQWDSVSEMVAA